MPAPDANGPLACLEALAEACAAEDWAQVGTLAEAYDTALRDAVAAGLALDLVALADAHAALLGTAVEGRDAAADALAGLRKAGRAQAAYRQGEA